MTSNFVPVALITLAVAAFALTAVHLVTGTPTEAATPGLVGMAMLLLLLRDRASG